VAHAFTVHALDTEVDYFTVVDDLNLAEETGAAHAGDMELGAGVFYGYTAVDVPLLVSNFTGCEPRAWTAQDPADARRVLKTLIRTIATASPGAKLGATAPYAYSDFVLLEAGSQQPRSLANAFLEAIRPNGDTTQNAIDALAGHIAAQEGMYGPVCDERMVATTREWRVEPEPVALDPAIDAILQVTFGEPSDGRFDPEV
jgi:CRISPR system Cascade subunit CasC